MTALPDIRPTPNGGPRNWLLRLAASRGFQAFAAKVPGLRRIARAEGEALFDIVAGFVNAQVLMGLVELRILHLLFERPLSARHLAATCNVPEARMQILLQAGAGLGLLTRQRNGDFGLALRGASLLGVPGLEAMISHHRALYADLADPVAFLRGGQDTELSRFWPYVFGASGARDPGVTATYSNLMAESQVLVAEDTLRMVNLSGAARLLDVGGGTGAFLAAVGAAYPKLQLDLFDLPMVLLGAKQRLASAGMSDRVTLYPGSFRDDPLPRGADVISLVRVLYDHDDTTVLQLLTAAYAALPPGGRLIVSEPMSGGAKPDRITDVYFAVYTLAMQTGRTRSEEDIGRLLSTAGFVNIRKKTGFRPFVTSVVTAETQKA
jgi:demethylspheroidene O-methyltransferase